MAKRLLTSAFTAQAVEFQSQHHGRVAAFAALVSGDDVDLVDRFRVAGSELGRVGLEGANADSFGLSITTRRGTRSCESATGTRAI
jgi:hypothetical protein